MFSMLMLVAACRSPEDPKIIEPTGDVLIEDVDGMATLRGKGIVMMAMN